MSPVPQISSDRLKKVPTAMPTAVMPATNSVSPSRVHRTGNFASRLSSCPLSASIAPPYTGQRGRYSRST